MRLLQKLRKFTDPAAALSAKRAIRRAIHPLPVSRFMSRIDQKELTRLQQTYGVSGSRDWPKYVEAERFLKLNIRRVQDLGLDRLPSQRILDLGSGAGFFLFVARVLGHTGMGLDIDKCPLFREMFELLGLQRIVHRIEKFKPLPDTGAQYRLDYGVLRLIFGHIHRPDSIHPLGHRRVGLLFTGRQTSSVTRRPDLSGSEPAARQPGLHFGTGRFFPGSRRDYRSPHEITFRSKNLARCDVDLGPRECGKLGRKLDCFLVSKDADRFFQLLDLERLF